MPNHMVNYKPGLTMDTPVAVTMAAADWAIFMAWTIGADTDGVNHIIYGIMSQQVTEALYTQASLKAAKAHHAEQQENPPIVQTLQQMGVPILRTPNLEDFQGTIFNDADQRWIIECGECHSRDEYEAAHTGELTCGHDGPRNVTEIIQRRKDQQ